MSVSPKSLWRVPVFVPYLQPDLTEEALQKAEREIGFKLPLEYVELLSIQNGGYIRWGLPGQVHDRIFGIGPKEPALGIPDWKCYGKWLPFKAKEGRKMIQFDGDGHWMLCFDYRKNQNTPAITLVDTEDPSEQPVAGSFSAYLKLLQPDVDEGDFALPNMVDLEALKQHLGTVLSMQIDKPSDAAHGYMQHRLVREGDQGKTCVWLSPNLVPRSFIRSGIMTRAEWLKRAASGDQPAIPPLGIVRRYPGLSDEAWIMTVSEEIIAEVLGAVGELGVEVRPLAECHGMT